MCRTPPELAGVPLQRVGAGTMFFSPSQPPLGISASCVLLHEPACSMYLTLVKSL